MAAHHRWDEVGEVVAVIAGLEQELGLELELELGPVLGLGLVQKARACSPPTTSISDHTLCSARRQQQRRQQHW